MKRETLEAGIYATAGLIKGIGNVILKPFIQDTIERITKPAHIEYHPEATSNDSSGGQ